MKAQIVAVVAVCMLSAAPLASAAATRQSRSIGGTALEGLESIVNGAENTIETAVVTANKTVVTVFEGALNSANAVFDKFVQSSVDKVTGTAGTSGIADFTACTAVVQSFTNLTTEVKDGAIQCAESGLSPLVTGINDLQAFQKTLDDLLSQGKELYDSCGDFNLVCQLTTVPQGLGELAATAATDATKVASLSASLAAEVFGLDEAKVATCAATEAARIVADFGSSFISSATTCFNSLEHVSV